MWSDVVIVKGIAQLVTDAFFAPVPAWYVRGAAKGDVIAAVAQGPGFCLVKDSLGHEWRSDEPVAGTQCVGIRPNALGWEVLYMQGPTGATYARVLLDDRLTLIALRSQPSPFGGTSQGFLDLAADGTPIMTDQHRSVVLGPLTIFLPSTRGDWTIGQDGNGIRLVAWHAGRQQAYEVWRGGTQTVSHLELDGAGHAVVAVANLPILVDEQAFTPWEPWPIPVPPPPPAPAPGPVPVPPPVPVPVPSPPPLAPVPVPVPAPEPPPPASVPVPVPTPSPRKPNIAKAIRDFFRALGKLFGFLILLTLVSCVDYRAAGLNIHPRPPAVVVPVSPEPSAPVLPQRATGDKLLDYRGCLGTLRDSANRVVWTPALPGAPADVRADWYARLRAAGCTHVPIGPFGPGPSYPGIVSWDNPDWRNDAAAIRGLVEELLNTPSADGLGFRPVIFTDGGPRGPKPRLQALFPVLSQALEGLDDNVIVVPAGWEPVVGDFTSAEVSWALETWHALRPRSVIGYHGSPARLVGSSNPLEADDPWQGGESTFYTSHGGQWIQIALYQTPHGDALYRPCDPDNEDGSCWANRWQDYVSRIGSGFHGWRVLRIVLFEVGTYETTHGRRTAAETVPVVRLGKRVCDKWQVPCGYGDGVPQ